MYATYTNLVKSVKEVFCDIDRTLKLGRPDIRCQIAGFSDMSRLMVEEKQHKYA